MHVPICLCCWPRWLEVVVDGVLDLSHPHRRRLHRVRDPEHQRVLVHTRASGLSLRHRASRDS